MSDPQQNVTPMPSKFKMGQVFLNGLIASRRRINGQSGTIWLTVVKLPAADEFSHPATIELRSHSPLGDPETKWSGIAQVTGFPTSFDSKPDENGEIKQIKSARVSLDVVEA